MTTLIGQRLAAFRGAIGFLSRLPVGHDERSWEAFRSTPTAFSLTGYLLGFVFALPFVLPLPAPTVALGFVVLVYLVAGLNHLDGVADLGDAIAVHGGAEDRLAVMADTTTGVGALLAVVVTVAGLLLAGLSLAEAPLRLLGVVVAAEVSAKLSMAVLAGLGSATHEGLGSQLTSRSRPSSLILPIIVALPAGSLTWPNPASAVALSAGLATSLLLLGWARSQLGGVTGDVLGAGNEMARVVALHAGVIAWTLS